jgi:PAS domain S-box-containing protein
VKFTDSDSASARGTTVTADLAPHSTKLLLVDDRRENLIALAAVLEPLGPELVLASSGTEALKHLLNDDFAVILLDVQMPIMDGFETAAMIKQRERSRHIPIIFVTAINKDERFAFRGYQSGAVDYLPKPIDPDMLRSKVKVFIELYEQNQKIKVQAEELRQAEHREAQLLREEAVREGELRHLAEIADREFQLRQFKATLDATLDAVFLFHPETLRFSYVNQGAASLLGYGVEEILQMTPLDLEAQGEGDELHRIIAPLKNADIPRAAQTYETRFRHKSGAIIPVEVMTQYVPLEEGQARFVSIVRDVSERKRAERQLEVLYAREKRISEALQQSIVFAPQEDMFPGLSIATLYQAAWDEANIGGDYLDVFALEQGKVALVVGDVSGKGLSAAARTAEVKYALRAFLRENPDPSHALGRLNSLLCGSSRFNGIDSADAMGVGAFICLSVVVLETSSGKALFGLAGSEPPLIVRSGGLAAESVIASGMPIGIDPEATHESVSVQLAKGDSLLLVTDGITEARTGYDFFGYERFQQTAEAFANCGSLHEMGRSILDAARAHAGGNLQDDACLLLASRR